MRYIFSRFTLGQQMAGMALVFFAGIAICMAISVGVLAKVKVTGPVYGEIIEGKDLIADILPPPEYIIESYLVVLQAAREELPAKRRELLNRFQQLEKEYTVRHEYWQKELPNDPARDILLRESFAPARAFYKTAQGKFFPALERGDLAVASQILDGPLRQQYQEHRHAIDRVVELTNGKNAAIEAKTASLLRTSNYLMAGVVIVVLAVLALVMMVVIRSVSGSFAYCAEIANRIAAGDLGVDVRTSGRGSVGNMLKSLQSMVVNLREMLSEISSASAQIESSAKELATSSSSMSAAADAVTRQVDAAATAGEEMAATSSEIASNCLLAAEEAREGHDLASTGEEVVRQTITRMGQIADRVTGTARTVESLGDRSDQIGAIIDTIEDIADQTNLLALNAAIEAARAGEQGRGFAVVADEVRALAERTTKATREISAMITSIQQETNLAVRSMEEGVSEVAQGTGDARKSGEALEEILAKIDAVAGQVSQIATAAEQQTATTAEISGSMHQISTLVEETSRGIQNTSGSATQLSQLAGNLQQIVSRFRLAG